MKTVAQNQIKPHPKGYTPAFDTIAEAGRPMEMTKGLFWLRMPLPFELMHINLWLAQDGDDWQLVDTGFGNAETRAAWETLFSSFLKKEQLKTVFITHFHPDHCGLLNWIVSETGAEVFFEEKEAELAKMLCDEKQLQGALGLYQEHYQSAGTPADVADKLIERRFNYKRHVTDIPDYTSIKKQTRWQVIEAHGHSPAHSCLYDPEQGVLIAGDIVLPDISPNIGIYPGKPMGDNPVRDYLASLDTLAKLPEDTLVLPSHGVPFYGLHTRIEVLKRHHGRRLQRLCDVLKSEGPQSAWQAMFGLFSHRTLEEGDIPFALGETLSHLAYAQSLGLVGLDAENRYFCV